MVDNGKRLGRQPSTEVDVMNRSPVETVLSTAGLTAFALLLLRWLRLRGRGPIVVTDGSGLQMSSPSPTLWSTVAPKAAS
jgi:hypothetical protein